MELKNYLDKWHNLDRFKTGKMDRKLVGKIIRSIHKLNKIKAPEIHFIEAPQKRWGDKWPTILGFFNKAYSKLYTRLTDSFMMRPHFLNYESLRLESYMACKRQLIGVGPWNLLVDTHMGDAAFIEYAINECHLKLPKEAEILSLFFELISNSFIVHCTKNVYYILERPSSIKLDESLRLHCLDGPAIFFGEKPFLYSLHGVTVDEQIIMRPETQNIDQIKHEENVEVKRIRIERYGWEKYLNEIKAKVVDARDNDVECTKESLLRGNGMCVLLCHCPSTGRVYTMEVPLRTKTCEQAQQYLWGVKKINIVGRS